MPPTGSTFTDWQQVERENLLFNDTDFNWSEPPQRRRRRITGEPVRARRAVALLEYEPESVDEDAPWIDYDGPAVPEAPHYDAVARVDDALVALASGEQSTETHSHFDEMMAQWNAAYGSGADRADSAERAFNLSDPGSPSATPGGRRTVVITGRGDERYLPAPRRRRQSELRFHERSGFSPDRAGLWAVLLGVALVIGCIVH